MKVHGPFARSLKGLTDSISVILLLDKKLQKFSMSSILDMNSSSFSFREAKQTNAVLDTHADRIYNIF